MQSIVKADREIAAWLRLTMAPGLKPTALRTLLASFGLPEAVLGQSFESLARVTNEASARAVLAAPGADFTAQLDAVLAWRDVPGNALLALDDPAYPPLLLTMPDPPPLLYVKGQLALLHTRSVAVVGSRSATPQGAEDAKRFSRAFSDAGLTVVSGLALGIDAAAHRGALSGRTGTVAVIGTGADVVYPPAHEPLTREIAANGAILSEWPLGTPARPAHFPQRNRLIAGLVNGVLIVEAAMRSGSLITARLANEMGRDVFALPGSIHAPLSRGCHRMIKQGAKLVETPEDVLEELGMPTTQAPAEAVDAAKRASRPAKAGSVKQPRQASLPLPLLAQDTATPPLAPRPPLPPDAQRLLDALGHAPTTLEILAARTEMDDSALQSALLRLELSGHLTALPGGRYVRASLSQADDR
ncbi:DNA-processing protein DprA [Paraburkholderia edwinii]|uniref:DNA-processing protein DprA n=1 Tax=Paraburkholderia edwinii TaxID=2861782 RepID=A0ABX8UIW7_9BURK|nr:DNA-processing protein DprA [Paraburkholderia edwinii]QYD68968.1 DNA-processing protein DprA [Paraburkholderia edwinii]